MSPPSSDRTRGVSWLPSRFSCAAVEAETEPVLGHVPQVLAHRRFTDVELRQGGHAPPRLVPEPGARRGPGSLPGDMRGLVEGGVQAQAGEWIGVDRAGVVEALLV